MRRGNAGRHVRASRPAFTFITAENHHNVGTNAPGIPRLVRRAVIGPLSNTAPDPRTASDGLRGATTVDTQAVVAALESAGVESIEEMLGEARGELTKGRLMRPSYFRTHCRLTVRIH